MGFRYFHGGIVSASTIPAGWYAEPGSIGRERYWNGSAWTSDARLVQQGDLSTGSAREETTVGATSRSKWRSRRLAIGVVVALLFVAISGFAIWTQVRLANTQTALNGKTAEAAQLRTDLLNTQQQLTDSRNQLASSQSQLADAQSQLTNTESQLSDARPAVGIVRHTFPVAPRGLDGGQIRLLRPFWPPSDALNLFQLSHAQSIERHGILFAGVAPVDSPPDT